MTVCKKATLIVDRHYKRLYVVRMDDSNPCGWYEYRASETSLFAGQLTYDLNDRLFEIVGAQEVKPAMRLEKGDLLNYVKGEAPPVKKVKACAMPERTWMGFGPPHIRRYWEVTEDFPLKKIGKKHNRTIKLPDDWIIHVL